MGEDSDKLSLTGFTDADFSIKGNTLTINNEKLMQLISSKLREAAQKATSGAKDVYVVVNIHW